MEYVPLEGQWEEAPDTFKSGLPVADETYIKNVRDNCLLDLPVLKTQKEHDKIMVMVCGGPTAGQHLEEIRAKSADPKYVLFCSNKTHDWLIGEDIIPDYHFIIDPKPSMLKYVEYPHPNVKYLIGISCDTRVFHDLKYCDVTKVMSVSGIGTPSDMHVIQALYPYQDITYLFGGTMAGLRVMGLADVMGFLTVEYYGFDSCFFEYDEKGHPIYYSYEKMRAESIMEAMTASGRTFLSTPVFVSQAKQFIKWKHRFEWINFIIHGDNLTAAWNAEDDERTCPKHDLLITDYARAMNKQMHVKEDTEDDEDGSRLYGCSGHLYAGQVSVIAGQIIKRCGIASVLDYGCGKKGLEGAMPPITGIVFRNYDPCIDGLDTPPEPADLVVCTDVLEHIEPECIFNVLADLKRVTKQLAFIAVSTRLAEKSFADGQNTHKIVESQEEWRPKIKKYFDIVETQLVNKDKFICILQAKGMT